MDSKDLLSLLKEPLFFDDWAAANFKAVNLPSDWLAAQQSPYQILGGDPWRSQTVRRDRRAPGLVKEAGRGGIEGAQAAQRSETGQFLGFPGTTPCRRITPAAPSPSGRGSHGRGGRPPERLFASVSSGQWAARLGWWGGQVEGKGRGLGKAAQAGSERWGGGRSPWGARSP